MFGMFLPVLPYHLTVGTDSREAKLKLRKLKMLTQGGRPEDPAGDGRFPPQASAA